MRGWLFTLLILLQIPLVQAATISGHVTDPNRVPISSSMVILNGTLAQEAFESVSIPTGTIYSGEVFTTAFYTSHSPNADSFIGVTITQSLIDLIRQNVSGGSYWMKLNGVDITPNPYSIPPYIGSELKITAGGAMRKGENVLEIYYTEYPPGALPSAPLPSMRAGIYYYPEYVASTATNENGYYTLNAPNGSYLISAFKEGYEACSSNPVKVTISGNNATVDFCLKPVNLPPVAVASASPSQATVGENISFSSTGSYDPDGTIVSYFWNFGDGTTSSEANPVHSYEYPGDYTVSLIIEDDKGATNSTFLIVKVRCPPPTDVEVTIKNNYDNESVLSAIRAFLVRISPIHYKYVDVSINATVIGDINANKCINNVKGEFISQPIPIFDYEENKSFNKVNENTYFLEYEHSSTVIELILGKSIDELIKRLLKISTPPIDTGPLPDVFLNTMYVTYNVWTSSPPVLQEGEVHSFSKQIRLPTLLDEFKNLELLPIIILSPADISVIDPEGREIGAIYENGTLIKEIEEIPGTAIYTGSSSEPQYIIFANPLEGTYKLKVHGTGNGTFNLTYGLIRNETLIFKKDYLEIPVTPRITYEYEFIIDKTPPLIKIVTPTNRSFINFTKITIGWKASDNIGLDHFEVYLDSIPYVNTTASNITLFNLGEGLHNVTVMAYDLLNNTNYSSVLFTVDTVPPSISISGVENGSFYNRDVTPVISVSDVSLNFSSIKLNGQPFISGTAITEDGSYSLEVFAMDMAGNTASAVISFVINKTVLPPVISIEYPPAVKDYEQFTIKASISGQKPLKVLFLEDSDILEYNRDGNAFSACVGPLSPGYHNFSVVAGDVYGNTAREDFAVRVLSGEVKIKAEGTINEENRKIKLKLMAKWKKGETKGELVLHERIKNKGKKIKKEHFAIHGKVTELYRDCEGNFRFAGKYKTHRKSRDDGNFSGVITENEVMIFLKDRTYIIPSKIKIKER